MEESLTDWIDSQSEKGQPATLMIFDDGDPVGHVYLANGPHFHMPAIVALDVPRALQTRIGGHLNFLWREHMAGKPVCAGQTTGDELDGECMIFHLHKPSPTERAELMRFEMAQTRYRWPKAKVLVLIPKSSHTPTIH